MATPITYHVGYANQSLDGSPCQTALLADPFAHQLAYASQMGSRMSLSDGPMDPGRLFEPPHDPTSYVPPSVGVVVLNSLTRPLKLTEVFFPQTAYSSGGQGSQRLYPSNTLADGTVINHVIPAVRPYPRAASHLDAKGNPALMGGVGYYSFGRDCYAGMGMSYSPGTITTIAGALGFSTTDDGSGPLVAVAFRVKIPLGFPPGGPITMVGFSTVQTNVTVGTLSALVPTLFPNFAQDGKYSGYVDPDPVSKLYDIAPGPDGLTIRASINSTSPTDEFTVTVWLSDRSSTLG